MENLTMFCLTMNDNHLNIINKLGYKPVGLGKKIFSNGFLKDNTQKNISNKNPYYGEYTFHYWLWKNYIDKMNDGWIGFCQYRKFWSDKSFQEKIMNFNDLNNIVKKRTTNDDTLYESIIGLPVYTNHFKLTKFIKKNFGVIIKQPSLLFNKKKRTIKFHFDLMHGAGNLTKAINLLDEKDKKDFNDFVNTEVSFNPHNMFICNSKKVLKNYYSSVFPWLQRCEEEFGFNLQGYGMRRIYGFLAERYMSFWFKKYTKYKTLPIIFKDISDFN